MGFASSLISVAQAFGGSYTVLDLGSLGGGFSNANAINNAGQVVGWSYTITDPEHAFRTSANSSITPADDLDVAGPEAMAFGINASGQVAGYLDTPAPQHAFRADANGVITAASDLGTLGGNVSYGYAINASGQVVGDSTTTGDVADHAFRTTANGGITAASDLGTFGGSSSGALGINDSGEAVGYAYTTGDSALHAFRTASNGNITAASDLGTLNGGYAFGTAINASGQVVGRSDSHAFRTAPEGNITAASDLGTLGGSICEADAINTSGQVVGWSWLPGDTDTHAFFVDVTGSIHDLNDLIPSDSGWVLNEALGINDLGQITGYGMIGKQEHAFLLTPGVPEPGSLSLLALSCLGLLGRHRKRRLV